MSALPFVPLRKSRTAGASRSKPQRSYRPAQNPAHGILKVTDQRVAWFDYAKGICILLVVMMHSTLGVGEAMGGEGFMHTVVAYAKPFRMPDFFLLSGLFLYAAIGRDWRTYLDRKVVHFAYFYLLWLTIQLVIRKGPLLASDPIAFLWQFAEAFVTPFPTLWFLYVLPIYFVVTKLLRGVPAPLLWLGAAVVHLAPLSTGWSALDDYGLRYYVYFVTGYLAAPVVFNFATWVEINPRKALAGVAAWAVLNGWLVFTPSGVSRFNHIADLPGIDIVAGLMGASAIIAVAVLMLKYDVMKAVRYAGQNSLVIYTAFTLPMAATRVVLVKAGIIADVGVVSLIVWITAASAPLILHWLLKGTVGRYLFERPAAFKFERTAKTAVPATTAATISA